MQAEVAGPAKFIFWEGESIRMGEQIDKTDRHILEELSIDSRALLTKLAKKIRTSKQTLQYRMQRMEKDGVVNAYITYVDWSRIGYMRREMLVKHAPMGESLYKGIIETCMRQGGVHITRCDGEWNMLVGYLGASNKELYEKANEIRRAFGSHMIETRAATLVDVYVKSMQKYDNENESGEVVGVLGAAEKRYALDDKDRLVLGALAVNARAPYAQIAEMTGLAPETVRFRIKRLEKEKVIVSYGVSINPELDGFNHFMILVRLSDPQNERIEKFIKYLLAIPKVRRVARVISTVDLIYEARFSDERELRETKARIERDYGDMIHSQTVLRLYGENLFAFFPPLRRDKAGKKQGN